ncbi:MAG: helix-turn-helix transcriptional regulator [Pseudomonadales bacterium]
MSDSANIFEEIELLYHCVCDPSYLELLLQRIRAKTQSISGSIQIDDLSTLQVVDGVFQGFSDSAIASYSEHFAPLDVSKQAAASSPHFYKKSVTLEELIKPKIFKASTFYNEWVKPQAHFADTMGACLMDMGQQQSLILTLQRDEAAGRFTDSNAQRYLEQLRPHLTSAMRAMSLRRDGIGSGTSVRYIDYPAMLLDKSMRLWECNAAAEALLGQCSWLWTRSGEKLQFQLPLQSKVEQGIEDNIDIFGSTASGATELVHTCDRGESFDLCIQPYRAQRQSVLFTPQMRSLVLLTIKPHQKVLDRAMLQRIYNLTRVETATVAHIFEGLSIRQICELTQRSEHTVRSSLKAIYQKVAVNRQAELVVKVANSAAYR